ncbi:MAG: methylenetetrahydrofolate reductase [Anaerolineae bacterium]|nr:methylenetetrahydrofolate reductase [Anaerolineae bacterium]
MSTRTEANGPHTASAVSAPLDSGRLPNPPMPLRRRLHSPSRLEARLKGGHFAVVAEIRPPDSADLSDFVRGVESLRPYVDTLELTDNPMGVPHVSNLAAGAVLAARGFDVMLNVASRDRNRIAQQSYLLGASALGIHNILCVTGDPPGYGDHPHAQAVADTNSVSLLRLGSTLRDDGMFESGRPLETAPALFLGAAESPTAESAALWPVHAARKVEAGAEFIATQPIFDVAMLRRYIHSLQDVGVTEMATVLAGVLALPSLEMAEYLAKVTSVVLPESLVERLRGVTPDQRDAEGLRIACETVDQVRAMPGVGGVVLFPIGLSHERLARLVDMAGIKPEPPASAPA